MFDWGVYLLTFVCIYIVYRLFMEWRDHRKKSNQPSGTIIVTQDEDGTYLALNINGSVHDFITKDEALLQIKHAPVSAQKTDSLVRKH